MLKRLAAAILVAFALVSVGASAVRAQTQPPNDTRTKLDSVEGSLKQIDSTLAKKELKGNDL